MDALYRVQLALADDRVVLEDPERGDQGLEGGRRVPPHLQRVEVDVSQERVRLNLDGLEVDDELLEGLEAEDLGLEADQDPDCEVEDEVFVSLEEKDLPQLVQEAELDNARVERGDQPRRVHLDRNVLPSQVVADLFVCVRQEQVRQAQAAREVGQLLIAAVEFVVQVVWNEALDEALEEGVDAGQVERGARLVGRGLDLPELVAEVLYRPCGGDPLPKLRLLRADQV